MLGQRFSGEGYGADGLGNAIGHNDDVKFGCLDINDDCRRFLDHSGQGKGFYVHQVRLEPRLVHDLERIISNAAGDGYQEDLYFPLRGRGSLPGDI